MVLRCTGVRNEVAARSTASYAMTADLPWRDLRLTAHRHQRARSQSRWQSLTSGGGGLHAWNHRARDDA